MRVRLRSLVLAVAGVMAVNPGGTYATSGISGSERPIVVKPGQQFDPALSGNLMSFTDTSTGDADVWYWDAGTGSLHPVATGAGDQILSDISGTSIVYVDRVAGLGDIKLFDIASGTTSNLTVTPTVDETDPTVSDRLIAWVTTTAPSFDVHVRDRLLGTETVLGGPGDQFEPAASGPRVAYVDDVAIKVYDATTGGTAPVSAGPALEPSIDGTHVAFTLLSVLSVSGSDIAVYDTSGTPLASLVLAGDQGTPHISGDWVSFEDYSTGIAHVGLWHWTTGDVFSPAPSTSSQQLNDISGNRLVYTDDRSGDLDIYAYEFSTGNRYQICVLYDQARAVKAGATIPIKLQLCDAAGHNLSSASITVNATGVSLATTNAPGSLEDAGAANPDNNFRYDAGLGGYIYNLSTKGLSTGTWLLSFTAGNDPTIHSVQFQVR